jgi:hypothetical protein
MRILAAAILLALAPASISAAQVQAQPSPPVSMTEEGIAIGG